MAWLPTSDGHLLLQCVLLIAVGVAIIALSGR